MGLENTAKRLNIDYVNRLDQEEYDV